MATAKKKTVKQEEPDAPVATEPLDKLTSIIKKEQLLALFIKNQRQQNRASADIQEAWKVFIQTVTPDNIDIYLSEEHLKSLVLDNRVALGYQPADSQAVLKRILDEVK